MGKTDHLCPTIYTSAHQCFHFTQRFRNSPCSSTVTTGFLSNSQCNVLVEYSGEKSHLFEEVYICRQR